MYTFVKGFAKRGGNSQTCGQRLKRSSEIFHGKIENFEKNFVPPKPRPMAGSLPAHTLPPVAYCA